MDQYKKTLIWNAIKTIRSMSKEGNPRSYLTQPVLSLDTLISDNFSQLSAPVSSLTAGGSSMEGFQSVLVDGKEYPEILLPYVAEAYGDDIRGKVESELLTVISDFAVSESFTTFTVNFTRFGNHIPFHEGEKSKVEARLRELSSMGAKIGMRRRRGREMPVLLAFQDGIVCRKNFEFLHNWCLNTFSVIPKSFETKEEEIISMTVKVPLFFYTPIIENPSMPQYLSAEEAEIMEKLTSTLDCALTSLFADKDLMSDIDLSVVRLALRGIEDIANVRGKICASMEKSSGRHSFEYVQTEAKIKQLAVKNAVPQFFELQLGVVERLGSLGHMLGLSLDNLIFRSARVTCFTFAPNFLPPEQNQVEIRGRNEENEFKIENTPENIAAITRYIRDWVTSIEEPVITVKNGQITRMEFCFSNPRDLKRIMEIPISDQNNDE